MLSIAPIPVPAYSKEYIREVNVWATKLNMQDYAPQRVNEYAKYWWFGPRNSIFVFLSEMRSTLSEKKAFYNGLFLMVKLDIS